MANIELIKEIREETNLSFSDIKKAIDELKTENKEEIIKYLREQGALKAQKRQDRQTTEGGIFTYVHEGRIGAMVEIKCETDFVARSDDFKALGEELTLHLAANQPKFLSEEDVDQKFIKSELEIARTQLLDEGKPEDKIEMILQGKKNKICQEVSLLTQPLMTDPKKTVQDLVNEVGQKTGEKIEVSRFTIYTL